MNKKITASTEIYGIFGNPVKHSKSPIIQNGWIKDEGINAVYVAFETKIENFQSSFKGVINSGIKGLNITAPFKELAASICDIKAQDVEIMGASNTIIIKDEKSFAYNTDGEGLVFDLDKRAKKWRENNEIVSIIGAGGAAKGIINALINANVKKINIIARDISKANALIENAKLLKNSNTCKLEAINWQNMQSEIDNSKLVINATTIGLLGNGNLDINLSNCGKNTIIYDMVYHPFETEFYKNAINNNLLALNGIGMLVGQGALAFEKWFGILPDFEIGLKRIMENA